MTAYARTFFLGQSRIYTYFFLSIYYADGEPGIGKEYMLSVHSSKAVLVEQVATNTAKYYHAYADAIIQLALAKGKREAVSFVSVAFYIPLTYNPKVLQR